MKIALDNLPTDIDLLQQLVRDLAGAVAGRDGALAESRIEIERLQSIIKQFLRAQFGRRSERLGCDNEFWVLPQSACCRCVMLRS